MGPQRALTPSVGILLAIGWGTGSWLALAALALLLALLVAVLGFAWVEGAQPPEDSGREDGEDEQDPPPSGGSGERAGGPRLSRPPVPPIRATGGADPPVEAVREGNGHPSGKTSRG